MSDLLRIRDKIFNKIKEFMPHKPEYDINKSLLCVFIETAHLDNEYNNLLIKELKKVLTSDNQKNRYEHLIYKSDSFISIIVCLVK